MIMGVMILVLSTGMFFFYLQGTCQKILRRQFEQAFWKSIVEANGLEFPSVRAAFEGIGTSGMYSQLSKTLQSDFRSLTFLAKNAANINQRHSFEERFLIFYFKLTFLSLVTRHALRLQEKPAAMKLTAILQYFANVVGERVNEVRFGNLTAADYLLNL